MSDKRGHAIEQSSHGVDGMRLIIADLRAQLAAAQSERESELIAQQLTLTILNANLAQLRAELAAMQAERDALRALMVRVRREWPVTTIAASKLRAEIDAALAEGSGK